MTLFLLRCIFYGTAYYIMCRLLYCIVVGLLSCYGIVHDFVNDIENHVWHYIVNKRAYYIVCCII